MMGGSREGIWGLGGYGGDRRAMDGIWWLHGKNMDRYGVMEGSTEEIWGRMR